jgi:alanine racemase
MAHGLKKIGYLESQICEIKDLPKGSTISYSGTCKLKRDSRVAVVEAGYYDGIYVNGPKDSERFIDKLRNLKQAFLAFTKNGKRFVYMNGYTLPILGRIGMKNFMIDVTDVECKVGDKVQVDINLIQCNQEIERVMI